MGVWADSEEREMNEPRPGIGQPQGLRPPSPQLPMSPHPVQPAHQTFRASVTGVVPVRPPPASELEPIELSEAELEEVPFGFPKDEPPAMAPVATPGGAPAP